MFGFKEWFILNNSTEKDFVFEDISSTSPSFRKEIISSSQDYGRGALRNIDVVIKIIAFVVALIVLVLFFGMLTFLFLVIKFTYNSNTAINLILIFDYLLIFIVVIIVGNVILWKRGKSCCNSLLFISQVLVK